MTLEEIPAFDFHKFLVPVAVLGHLKAWLGRVGVELAHDKEPDKAKDGEQGKQARPAFHRRMVGDLA